VLVSVPAQPHIVAARFIALTLLSLAPSAALAGGPKYVAGATYFDPSVLG